MAELDPIKTVITVECDEAPIMIKRLLLATALLSLALATGCATGGNGPCVSNCATIAVSATSNGIPNVTVIGLNLTITFTAVVSNITPTAVNWTITGASCSGSGASNPCGYFTSTSASTAIYQAPSSVPSNPSISIVATLQSDSSVTGSLSAKIVPITTDVAPATLNIGKGLTQQFTAVAVPDNAPQTFTWTCTANGNPCASFMQDPNVSGLAYYNGQDTCTGNGCVHISAAATVNSSGCSAGTCTVAEATPVASRLTGNSTKPSLFAFRFSGYDNNGKQVFVAGTFTATNGSITSGVEDEIAWNGSQYAVTTNLPITGGTYAPTAVPNSSNNAGALTLTLPSGVYPNQFQAVLDGAGDIQMIESDGHGYGSGIVEASANSSQFNSGSQTFAFGFTGIDSSANRVGYAGLLPTNGSGTVPSGEMDINDNGNTGNICGTSPCTFAGQYAADSSISGLWHLTMISAVTMHFDFFIANGTTNANTPLTIYAISTDPVDAQHAAVLGTMVLQDSTQTYNNAAFNGTSVSPLIGVSQGVANVSLTLGTTDGAGDFSGQFDQNNAGTILSVSSFPPTGSNAYTYAAASSSNGRYIFQMLGNPNASPVVAPLPFVLYASGANRGFLLDQSSTSVMTGTMIPQPDKVVDDFFPSAVPGTYALATNAVSDSTTASTAFIASNLLLTSTGNQTYNVNGTQNPGSKSITGNYSLNLTSGAGAIALTSPETSNYVVYFVDLTHFFLFDSDKGVSSPLFYAEE
jgi:hypothetical protein